MVFNPYALIDIAGAIAAILLLLSIYNAIKNLKYKIIILIIYLSSSLMVLMEAAAISLKLQYAGLIMYLIDLEFLFAIISFTFLFYFIASYTHSKINIVLLIITILYQLSIPAAVIFFPHQYTIINLKIIPTGYFGIYGSLINPVCAAYAVMLCVSMVYYLLKNYQLTSNPIRRTRFKYILYGLFFYLLSGFIFFMLQTFFAIYTISVGGINFTIILLGFVSLVFIDRSQSHLHTLIKNKLWYNTLFFMILGFFIFLFIHLKKIWCGFIPADSPVFFSIFIFFSVIYLLPVYNKFQMMLEKLMYQGFINLSDTIPEHLEAMSQCKNSLGLRNTLWNWFEQNYPVNNLSFFQLNDDKIQAIDRIGNRPLTPKRVIEKTILSIIKTFPSQIISYNNQLYFFIKYKDQLLQIVFIENFQNNPLKKYVTDIIHIILLNYHFFHINYYLNEHLVVKNKMNLLHNLSKNFKKVLTKTKINISELQTAMKIHASKNRLKNSVIRQLNLIIKDLQIK